LAHGDERRACGFGVFDKVLPAVGVFFFEDDGGDVFGDERTKAAHAVAGDEGHHVILERNKIVRLHQLIIVSETRVRRTGINGRLFRCSVDWLRLADTSLNVERYLRASKRKAGEFGSELRGIFEESQMIFSKDYVGYLARQTV